MGLKRPSTKAKPAAKPAAKATVKKSAATKSAPASKAGAGTGSAKKTLGSGKAGGNSDDISEDDLLKLVPGGLAGAFVKAKLHEKTLEMAGLVPPADWDGSQIDIPNDIASTDHDELSNLLAKLVNAQSAALHYATAAHVEAGFYEDIRDYLENVALTKAEGSNDLKRKANARLDEAYVAAQSLWRTANSDYIEFRDHANQLEKKWRTVSRVGGFVGDDAEGQGASLGKAGSAKGRGAGSSKAATAQGSAKKTLTRRRK